ncbi:MAG: hypothetical protein M0Z41_12295 [Peptococcaceae bacterium]|nr:hypothetical protein [Peptococcaceae bacterium]
MKDLAFEVYTPRKGAPRQARTAVRRKPGIRISKSSLVFNKPARALLGERVELAFDREERVIRVKTDPAGLAIKKTKLFGKGFFKTFGIVEQGFFPVVEEDGTLYARLS